MDTMFFTWTGTTTTVLTGLVLTGRGYKIGLKKNRFDGVSYGNFCRALSNYNRQIVSLKFFIQVTNI